MTDSNVLTEQRFKQTVVRSRVGMIHVMRYTTFKAASHPGMWTRRAADRRTLCGSMVATVVGLDAKDWPRQLSVAQNISDLTCVRCRERYNRWLRKKMP